MEADIRMMPKVPAATHTPHTWQLLPVTNTITRTAETTSKLNTKTVFQLKKYCITCCC